MGEPRLDLDDTYYDELIVERSPVTENAGAYLWVHPKIAVRRKTAPVPATIEEAVRTVLDIEPGDAEPPAVEACPPHGARERDADPCRCAFCAEARGNGVLYVQFDGATVIRPMVLIAETAEVAGADPMRYCGRTGALIDRDAPDIRPWTTDEQSPAACCRPLRKAMDSGRLDVPPFGDTVSIEGAGGFLLMVRCPWCATPAVETIRKLAGR